MSLLFGKMNRKMPRMELVLGAGFLLSFITPCECIGSCNIHPRFWCDNVDVAKQCEVFEQCQSQWQSFKGKDAPLVNFTLYYESLCPDCRYFFALNLGPAFKKIFNIMNLALVPYGNAVETKVGNRWKFQCQHGPSECTGNIIETCTINIVRNITVYFPFLLCMETSSLDPIQAAKNPIVAYCVELEPNKEFLSVRLRLIKAGGDEFPAVGFWQQSRDIFSINMKCSQQNPVHIEEILTCLGSDEGNLMEHEMAVKTDALQPSHTYVPWVTLNGIHTEAIQKEAQTDLVKLICSTYRGHSKPPACWNA